MGVERGEQVQLRILLDVDAQVKERLNRRVAGDKIVGAGPKEKTFKLDRPILTAAMGRNSQISEAISSAVPTGYSGM